MIIHAFCERISQFFCNKGRVTSQIVVALIVLYYTKLIPTSKDNDNDNDNDNILFDHNVQIEITIQ